MYQYCKWLMAIMPWCMMTTGYGVTNRDGCVNMADPCICANTGVKGFCFPGSHSQSGELYCNCQADVYSPYEIAYLWVKRFVLTDPLTQYNMFLKYGNELFAGFENLGFQVLADLGRSSKNPKRDGVDLAPSFEAFLESAKKKPILGHFFKLSDGCTYVNQACTCGNSGLKGVCGINYPKNGKVFRADELYCHCD